jgi:hypothetical protein
MYEYTVTQLHEYDSVADEPSLPRTVRLQVSQRCDASSCHWQYSVVRRSAKAPSTATPNAASVAVARSGPVD